MQPGGKWFKIKEEVKMMNESEINKSFWILLKDWSLLMKVVRIFSSRTRKSLFLNYFSLYISEMGAFSFLTLQMSLDKSIERVFCHDLTVNQSKIRIQTWYSDQNYKLHVNLNNDRKNDSRTISVLVSVINYLIIMKKLFFIIVFLTG